MLQPDSKMTFHVTVLHKIPQNAMWKKCLKFLQIKTELRGIMSDVLQVDRKTIQPLITLNQGLQHL